MSHHVRIAQQIVPVVGADPAIRDKVLAFEPFKEWVHRFDKAQQERDSEMDVRSIEIQSADVFSSGKLGFVKFNADVRFKENGKSAPGITFMRGGSVGVLTILKSSDDAKKDDLVLLTVQPRIATACLAFPEIPAGMLDGSGNFTGTAAREIFEETGLKIEEDELIDMTAKAYGDRWQGVYPSAGGCDEFLRLFLCIKKMKSKDIKDLEGKLTGMRDSGENITLKLVPLRDAWKTAPDAKLLSSLALYHALQLDKSND
ncbi:hypothetical protein BX666DRAFT_2024701 [Dichotomocladium elegans]|nr:hypothetical protein BX666DRAFT_2024701 [Dichotomocladium elegans]